MGTSGMLRARAAPAARPSRLGALREPASAPAPGADRPVAAGVTADFEAFYRDEYHAIFAVVLLLTGDRGGAEDVVQESFTAAYLRWGSVGRYERPGAWVRRVALNRAISGLRRRRSERRALERAGSRLTLEDPRVDAPDDALWMAVRRLPARQAQVVALVYVEDRSVADVAEILGCRVGSVKQHLARARARLAEVLGDEVDEGEDQL
jgi:RNA polymerase sigma-70 factor (sigma-E family)